MVATINVVVSGSYFPGASGSAIATELHKDKLLSGNNTTATLASATGTDLQGHPSRLLLKIVGTGLTFDAGGLLTSGTMTSLALLGGSPGSEVEEFRFSGFSYNVAAGFAATPVTPLFGSVGFNIDAHAATGTKGQVSLLGGDYADTIVGSAVIDVIGAKDGADSISTGLGNDAVLAGAGNDTVRGGGGADGIFGDLGNDSIWGDGENDVLSGGGGNDRLDGGGGGDGLVGEDGSDTLTGGAGKDTLVGGANIDTAVYSEKTLKVEVTLTGNTVAIVKVSGVAEDTINTIENLIGGSAGDKFIGDGLANLFDGRNGNDTLSGAGGNDTLVGGWGKDSLTGGANNDVFKFLAVADSAVGANADRITDFDDAGDDRIDVSALFGPAMTYRGTSAFTASGQVHVVAAGNDVVVEVNTGGPLAADFSIRLVGTTIASMTAATSCSSGSKDCAGQRSIS